VALTPEVQLCVSLSAGSTELYATSIPQMLARGSLPRGLPASALISRAACQAAKQVHLSEMGVRTGINIVASQDMPTQ